MPRHRLNKVTLLYYALEGAQTLHGISFGHMDDREKEMLQRDIREIVRRIKLVEIARARWSPDDDDDGED